MGKDADIGHKGHNGSDGNIPINGEDSPNDTDHDIAEIPYKLHQGHHDPREKLGFPHAMVQILVDGIKMIFGLMTAIIGNDNIVATIDFFNIAWNFGKIILLLFKQRLTLDHNDAGKSKAGKDGYNRCDS